MNARLTAVFVCLAASAHAAELTRVASSFEPGDPFGLFIDLTYGPTVQRGKIVREWYQAGDNIDVTELRYQMVEHKLAADIHLGLYKDLELHFGIPFIFAQDREWWFAKGTDQGNSTIYNNCLRPDGSLTRATNVACGPTNRAPLFTFDPELGARSYRGGLGDLTFGLAWAVLNQKKDDAAPTWVLSFDYTAPIAEAIDPTAPTTNSERGAIGDKIHRYKFSTAISKRIAFADPYFSLHYTLPWKSSGFYSNCDHADASRSALPGNCGLPGWNREQTGIFPSHVGGFIFGAEFNAFEAASKHQKLAVDIRGSVTYVSEGRYYNPMSDLFGKLLYSGDYVAMSAQLGIIGHAAEFVHLKLYGELTYNTEHTLTSESIGKDLVEPLNGTVDITAHPEEISPQFDYRIDRVGRRFRIQEETVFRFTAQVSFNF